MLATKTLAAIEEAFQKDQGARYRGLLRQLMPHAEDAYNDKEEDFRNHLGASLIGKDCDREIWYSWRWAKLVKFSGQMLRLFNRGHLEEPRMIALLMLIGCKVWFQDENGKQFRIHGHRGHFGGGMDGVAQGIPDMPDVPMLTEYKTHNLKSFTKLVEAGVLSAKWQHFVQMQEYMGKNNLTHALYVAVCKDNDQLYMEIVPFDKFTYDRADIRVVKIIDSKGPPPKINKSPSFYYCKSFCDYSDICHKQGDVHKSCRSCKSVEVHDGGEWFCNQYQVILDSQQQRAACSTYELIPDFKG